MTGLLLPLAAVVAGLLSITSPCALPLIPGYVSYVSALPVTAPVSGRSRGVVLRSSFLFVAGFSFVFTALGVTASALGVALIRQLPMVTRASGVLIIVTGLAALGVLRLPWLSRERRIDLARVRPGPLGAFPLGMAFAFGWTPCVGPVLATILAMAASSGSVITGGMLLLLYSLGLGVPFLLIAMGCERLSGSLAWFRRHGRSVERAGGVLMVAVGTAFITGAWDRIFLPAQTWFARYGWPPI